MHRWLLVALLSGVMAACGGGDDEEGADAAVTGPDGAVVDASTPDASGPDATPTPGTLTIEASGITGANGKIVLAFVQQPGGGAVVGQICEPVTADPGSISGVAKMQAGGGNPCALGAEVTIDPGMYEVNAGLYTPGMMTPDLCASTTVVVNGDSTATLPAFDACPGS